jgi:hypothetical protein
MSLPLRSEVHVSNARRNFAQPAGGASQGSSSNDTAAPSELVAASVLKTVFACSQADAALSVVRLDIRTRACVTAHAYEPSPVLGVIQSKPTPQTAIVVTYGPVDGFADLTPGARYFLAADGALACPPLQPQDTPYVHPVGIATSTTQLFVSPQWPRVKRAPDA